jgi:hypothetical protein
MNKRAFLGLLVLSFWCTGTGHADSSPAELKACVKFFAQGFRPIAKDRADRFLGKVQKDTALCRGGEEATRFLDTPWVDWSKYWGAADESSRANGPEAWTLIGKLLESNGRGIDGSLIDLEYQRIELIKFNLFDNYTYETYIKGLGGKPGSAVRRWDEMRLSADHPNHRDVGGDGLQQCGGELVRFRTLTGICNDLWNPKMGSSGTYFSRNAQFESTYPQLYRDGLMLARHSDPVNGKRLELLKPDPQLISRELFTRVQRAPEKCNEGRGVPGNPMASECDYRKATSFNVLAAFWIQFMTHDWFSHLDEGRNKPGLTEVGCGPAAQAAGCRPGDRAEAALIAVDSSPEAFSHQGKSYLKRAQKLTTNNVTAWWDASQIYGYDAISQKRVLRDPRDKAKLLQPNGYLPLIEDCKPNCTFPSQWTGQELAAFPDNWNIGLSFYHNLFVREHNSFVAEFRKRQRENADGDSGLRNPRDPRKVIPYAQVSDEEIFQAGRLVVSAMIAKIHTIEWTTQLLYDEPLFRGMNANWFGLFDQEKSDVSVVLQKILNHNQSVLSRFLASATGLLGRHGQGDESNARYSVLASGAGIFGLGNTREEGVLWWKRDAWDVANPQDVNGGANHFGSPFNFPEEFTSVYRLHPLVPDLIEFRDTRNANVIKTKVPVVETVRGKATAQMREGTLENWGLSMGRQRLGALHLQNHPMFLQNLEMKHLGAPSGKLDIVALDIIRDRERGVPRFNEFRRQIGLKSLKGFDDFVNVRLPESSPERKAQQQVVEKMRKIYGTHKCDSTKKITDTQREGERKDSKYINDCLGHPDGDGRVVDNVEDVDLVVGWLAEYTRPHGFAISETQFHIFIINASRRLFSDRFFTSSFRPEFYSRLGYDWVMNNGPPADCPYALETGKDGKKACNEPQASNGHKVPVSPLKRVLMRNVPPLREELTNVVNVFDPWARDRGTYYSLAWEPRKGAESDPAFGK